MFDSIKDFMNKHQGDMIADTISAIWVLLICIFWKNLLKLIKIIFKVFRDFYSYFRIKAKGDYTLNEMVSINEKPENKRTKKERKTLEKLDKAFDNNDELKKQMEEVRKQAEAAAKYFNKM